MTIHRISSAPRAYARNSTAPSLFARFWVLAVFAAAPLLPGYRGLRIPLMALAAALFAG
jgi:hypothetical protein